MVRRSGRRGVFRCTPSSLKFSYGKGCSPASSQAVTAMCNVYWVQGRGSGLELAMYDILTALSHGKPVVVHCERSFHRGPIGFMAVVKRLFGIVPTPR